jgi:hypothetical protein
MRNTYKQEHLIDLYENLRFKLPFMVYRKIKYWPIMDFICTYCHFVNNIIIILLAVYYNVNVVMFVNIVCMCILYMVTTINANSISNKISLENSLQSQCDLRLASIVSKKYHQEIFKNFLDLRYKIWKF